MSEHSPLVSTASQTVMAEAPAHAQAWGAMVQGLAQASALDAKTSALAYLAVLAALRLESGIPFHVQAAKQPPEEQWSLRHGAPCVAAGLQVCVARPPLTARLKA